MVRLQKSGRFFQRTPFCFDEKEAFPGAFLLPFPQIKGDEPRDQIATGGQFPLNKTLCHTLCVFPCRKSGKKDKIAMAAELLYSTFFRHRNATVPDNRTLPGATPHGLPGPTTPGS